MRRVLLALCLTACSDAPSDPKPVVTPVVDTPEHPAPDRAVPPPSAEPADAGCDPRVTEVWFVPDGEGSSVTILGEGFCQGAGPPSARFGDVPVTSIVVASSGKSMVGKVARMPPSGATLVVHTPPGHPTVTSYVVTPR